MSETAFLCPDCGKPMRMQVQATISAPAELMHKFSKSNIARKDVQLLGVNWETADRICVTQGCDTVIGGLGNYMTKLQKKERRLDRLIEAVKSLHAAFVAEGAPKVGHGPGAPTTKYWILLGNAWRNVLDIINEKD